MKMMMCWKGYVLGTGVACIGMYGHLCTAWPSVRRSFRQSTCAACLDLFWAWYHLDSHTRSPAMTGSTKHRLDSPAYFHRASAQPQTKGSTLFACAAKEPAPTSASLPHAAKVTLSPTMVRRGRHNLRCGFLIRS